MIKRVFSAGGIVIKNVSNVTNEIRVLVTQHSKHKGWDFPKGHLELRETSEQAAIREVFEETGVVGEVVEKVGESKYFYFDSGERVFKTVVYFLMKFVDQGDATTPEEVSEIVWLPVDKVEEKLTFKDTKEVWREALKQILDYRF